MEENTHKFYSDSELHPFIPNKKSIKLFASNIWKVLIPFTPPSAVKLIKQINLFDFVYYEEALGVAAIFGALFVAFYLGRTLSINKKIKLFKAIHNSSHNCRNSIVKIQNILDTKKESPTISELCSHICNDTLEVFEACKSKKTIGVAIRLSGFDKSHRGCYSTICRAGNLSNSRQTTHLNKKQGIAKILLDQNKNGCVIIPNTHKASLTEFIRTENEQNFKDEVKSMIAAPLCVQEGNGGEMIGILHISSKGKKAFNQDDVALAKALADMAAAMIASKKKEIDNSDNEAQDRSQQQTPTPTIIIARHPSIRRHGRRAKRRS